MTDGKYISQAIAGALEIMKEQPLTLGEFIDEVMGDFMEQEPGDYIPLGDMHKEWESAFTRQLFVQGVI